MKTCIAAVALVLASSASARTFTVTNKCPYTVWPAIYTDLKNSKSVPSQPTGWEAKPRSTVSFHVPDDWESGRIWGRRDCDFRKPGAIACATGSCNGGLKCDPHTGTGVPPVTIAEWTLGLKGQPDNYDVSLVDGYNVPMTVTPTGGCPVVSCKANLNTNCPKELVVKDSKGETAGCKTACAANLDGNPGNSPNCCSGSHGTAATCPKSGVKYYEYFKKPCPNAYAYAYDDKTSLKTCDAKKKADYHVVFCG